jgi:hypothetical protein
MSRQGEPQSTGVMPPTPRCRLATAHQISAALCCGGAEGRPVRNARGGCESDAVVPHRGVAEGFDESSAASSRRHRDQRHSTSAPPVFATTVTESIDRAPRRLSPDRSRGAVRRRRRSSGASTVSTWRRHRRCSAWRRPTRHPGLDTMCQGPPSAIAFTPGRRRSCEDAVALAASASTTTSRRDLADGSRSKSAGIGSTAPCRCPPRCLERGRADVASPPTHGLNRSA